MNKKEFIVNTLQEMFPNASCELVYHNNFELLISIILSAQTTDKKVNSVTPLLFGKYPDAYKLMDADIKTVASIIRILGLANSKAKNIILTAKMLVEKYDGNIPNTKAELVKLAGVGVKTANVYMAEGLGMNAFGVDTHVLRVSNRLGISKSKNPLVVEADLINFFPNENWAKLHIQFIFFGRYHCTSRNPKCANCKFIRYCHF